MKLIFFILLVFTSFFYAQRADFFKEDITFRLVNNYFGVEGYYWFTNHSGKQVNSNIFYPFPSISGKSIDSIYVFNITAGRQTYFINEDNNGISFNLSLAPLDTVIFQIGYRQKLNGDSAVYILKTTQGWNKPLESAEYKLIAPSTLNIRKFTCQPDTVYKIESYKIYYWKKKDFMPENDMMFYF
jgi:hypothetical protein